MEIDVTMRTLSLMYAYHLCLNATTEKVNFGYCVVVFYLKGNFFYFTTSFSNIASYSNIWRFNIFLLIFFIFLNVFFLYLLSLYFLLYNSFLSYSFVFSFVQLSVFSFYLFFLTLFFFTLHPRAFIVFFAILCNFLKSYVFSYSWSFKIKRTASYSILYIYNSFFFFFRYIASLYRHVICFLPITNNRVNNKENEQTTAVAKTALPTIQTKEQQ